MKFVLEDFSAKVGSENISKQQVQMILYMKLVMIMEFE
jgi:hypothetical protein